MHAFAQRSRAAQQNVPAEFAKSGRVHPGRSREVRAPLRLQRAVESQGVEGPQQRTIEERSRGWTGTASPHFGRNFSRIPILSPSPVRVQTKLTVNAPGDVYEQEADRVAEQIVHRRESELQRTCACGGGCPECERAKEATGPSSFLQSRPQPSGSGRPSTAPPIVNQTLRSPGQPLDARTRAFMEPRFGRDFTHVRVHTGTGAAEAAGAVQAKAFTVDNHVVFGAGQFSPASGDGRRLLAHELTHVVQQSSATRMPASDRAGRRPTVAEAPVAIIETPGGSVVQRDWALPTAGCATPIQPLTAAQVENALQHSQGVLSIGGQIGYARDVLGISRRTGIIDQDFVNALLRFQVCFGLVQSGMLDHATASKLFEEMVHEAVVLGRSSPIADDTMVSLLRYIIGVEALRANMAAVARTEYADWNRGAAVESDPAQLDELQNYWSSVSANPNPLATQSARDITPWSAAFISHVVTSAEPDAGTMGFAPAAGHITYIREALRNRECPETQRCQGATQVIGTRFRLYQPTEVTPLAGDLICKNRGHANFTYNGLRRSVCDNGQCPWGTTHCDIVEEVNPDQNVVTIGGNTANTLGVQTPAHTVGARALAIDQDGLLTNVDDLIGIIRVV
ncbi:MAG: DUF2272 domain-containing protein [Gemmatimonas sp.]|nr:DUF2272 domain-containing protein [Gemmatimonas sp.]